MHLRIPKFVIHSTTLVQLVFAFEKQTWHLTKLLKENKQHLFIFLLFFLQLVYVNIGDV